MFPSSRSSNVSSRFPEFLENIKLEFDNLVHDVSVYKMQRDECERKLQLQLNELNTIQQMISDMERTQVKIKQQYEDEIVRLRRQIEINNGGAVNTIGPSGNVSLSASPLTAPNLPFNSTISTGGSLMNVLSGNLPLSTRVTDFSQGKSASTGGGSTGPISELGKRGHQSLPIAPSNSSTPTKKPRENEGFSSVPHLQTSLSLTSPLSIIDGVADASKQLKTDSGDTHENIVRSSSPTSDDHDKQKIELTEKRNLIEDSGADWNVMPNIDVKTSLNVSLLHHLEHTSVVCCVKFSGDGKALATGCNKSAQIFDIVTGEKTHSFIEDTSKDGDLYIRSVCFSPNGQYLAAGAEDKTVKVWNIEEKRLYHVFVGHELDIYSLDFSRDGNFIVSGSGDRKTKIWDLEKKECLFTLGNDEVGPKDGITSVAFSPDSRLIATGSLDRVVRLWDAQNGHFLERFEGHTDSVYSVAFSPDGKTLASGSLDRTVKLWEVSTSRSRLKCRSTLSNHKDFVLSVAFSPDGNWLISGSKDRTVQFWDPRSSTVHMMLQGHKNSVISVAISPTGKEFATGGGDFKARCWRFSYDKSELLT